MASVSASFLYYPNQCFLFKGFGQPEVIVDGHPLNIQQFRQSSGDLPEQSEQPNIGGVGVTINVMNQATDFSAGIDGVYLPGCAVRIKRYTTENQYKAIFTLTAIGRILLGIYRLFGIQPYIIYIKAPIYVSGIEDKKVLYEWIMESETGGTFGISASLVPKNQFQSPHTPFHI